jgi:hypothetical protein
MITIYARSPYLVSINQASQVATKVELFIWDYTSTEPVTPTITLSKNIPSLTQIACTYDVAPYIREKIQRDFLIMEDGYDVWTSSYNYVNVRIKRYYKVSGGSFTLLTNIVYNAVNGYGEYQQGANVQNPWVSSLPYFTANQSLISFMGATQAFAIVKPLFNYDNQYSNKRPITTVSTNFVSTEIGMLSFIVEKTLPAGQGGTVSIAIGPYEYNMVIPATPLNSYYVGVPYPPLSEGNYDITLKLNSVNYSILGQIEYQSECKYTPVTVMYVNKFGGIEQFTFFKTKTESFDISSTSYNLYQLILPNTPGAYYQQIEGQSKDFNVNGSETFKVSSGFVPERYGIRIKELMLSETIKVYDYTYGGLRPVKVKTKSMKFQKHINDKTINYELEFEYLNDIINNIS